MQINILNFVRSHESTNLKLLYEDVAVLIVTFDLMIFLYRFLGIAVLLFLKLLKFVLTVCISKVISCWYFIKREEFL